MLRTASFLLLFCFSTAYAVLNSFSMIPVTDPQTLSAVNDIQQQFVMHNFFFQQFMRPLDSLHFTIDVYNITKDQEEGARKAIAEIARAMCSVWPETISFKGLNTFFSQEEVSVLFAEPDRVSNTFLTFFHDFANQTFAAHGIKSIDRYEFYEPHMTIMEIKKSDNEDLFWIIKQIYNRYDFKATAKIESLQFCYMGKKRVCEVVTKEQIANCRSELPSQKKNGTFRSLLKKRVLA